MENRNSNIELLKIFAILLIVLSHVSMTLGQIPGQLVQFSDYVFNLGNPISNISANILRVFLYFANVGNAIFFICSSWFLCDRRESKKEKVFHMLLDVWLVSVIILVGYLLSSEKLSIELLIKSLFPTIFSNNWYVTCYILFYLIVPHLNYALDRIEERRYLKMNITLFIVYFVFGFILPKMFFANELIIFIVIHIFVFYIKKFRKDLIENKKLNIVLFYLSISLLIIFVIAYNYIGLLIPALNGKMMRFSNLQNPLAILIALSSFMLVVNSNSYNKLINRIASLSLLIYIIHENILFSTYSRLSIEVYLLQMFGQDNIILVVLVFALLLFIVVSLLSYIYQITIQKLTKKASHYLFDKYDALLDKITNSLTH